MFVPSGGGRPWLAFWYTRPMGSFTTGVYSATLKCGVLWAVEWILICWCVGQFSCFCCTREGCIAIFAIRSYSFSITAACCWVVRVHVSCLIECTEWLTSFAHGKAKDGTTLLICLWCASSVPRYRRTAGVAVFVLLASPPTAFHWIGCHQHCSVLCLCYFAVT